MPIVHIGRDPVLIGADNVLVQSVGLVDACTSELRLVHTPIIAEEHKYPYTGHKPTSELNFEVKEGFALWAWTPTPFTATYNVTNPSATEGIELEDVFPALAPGAIFTPAVTDLSEFPTDLSVDGLESPGCYIDVDCSAGDIDISTWYPAGLVDGALCVLRKVDSTHNKIIFTDALGFVYDYVSSQRETLILMNFNAVGEFRVI